MKAIIYNKYGPPSVLQMVDMDTPSVDEHELLVRVKAASVNRTDCAMLRAKPVIMRFITGLIKPRNPILGTEFAGIIEKTGSAVTQFKPGDPIFGFDDIGVSAHAEFLSISESAPIAIIPSNVTFKQAACSIEGAHYAHNFLNKVSIPPGAKVLINGASGAIGSAMLQLLASYDVHTDVVVGTPNVELAKRHGANRVYDYLREDFTQSRVIYDYVFDTVGKSSFGKCKTLLSRRGVYISSELGFMAQNAFFALTTPVLGGKQVRFPFPGDKPGSVRLIRDLLAGGKYLPVIDREFTLDQVPEAFRYVETGQKIGNVVVAVP